MIFSLIVPTINRIADLDIFFNSVLLLNFDLSKIEIIVVDQNEKGYLSDLIQKYDELNIIHIYSKRKGLSYNRNLGMRLSSGNIICFPDDDCQFYPDTFSTLYHITELNPSKCLFIGCIYDREKNIFRFKNWSSKNQNINTINFYFFSSSITMFIRKNSIVEFDEQMGVGAKYGSCEDVDFIYHILKKTKLSGFYSPLIQVNHADPKLTTMPLSKVKSYASGFGYFISKNFDLIKLYLLLLLLSKKFYQFVQYIILRKYSFNYFIAFFSGLYIGLLKRKI